MGDGAVSVSPGVAAATVAAPSEVRRLGHLVPLDGLRGIAVALVVVMHTGHMLWPETRDVLVVGGSLGVHLFFVLSGFLITALLLSEHERSGRIDLAAFARRRLLRLFPAMAALFAVLAVIAVSGTRLRLSAVGANLFYNFTFTSNLAVVHGDLFPVTWLFGRNFGTVPETGHLWSVGVEAQFYVVSALTLWAATRLRWSHARIAWLIVGLIAAVALWRAYLFATGGQWLRLYLAPSTRLDAPLVGALVGVAWSAGWLPRVDRRWAALVGGGGLAGFLVAGLTVGPETAALYYGLYTVLAFCGAVAIAAMVRAPDDRLARVLSWRPLVMVGVVSYSVYVWHFGIFLAIERHDPSWPGLMRTAAGWALTAIASWSSWRFVEQPFLRRKA